MIEPESNGALWLAQEVFYKFPFGCVARILFPLRRAGDTIDYGPIISRDIQHARQSSADENGKDWCNEDDLI